MRTILKISRDTWQTSDGVFLICRQYKGLFRISRNGYNVLHRMPDGTYRQSMYCSWYPTLASAVRSCCAYVRCS